MFTAGANSSPATSSGSVFWPGALSLGLQMKKLGPQSAGELLSAVEDAVPVALSQGTPSWAISPPATAMGN